MAKKKSDKIIIVKSTAFTMESAKALSEETGMLVVIVENMDDIRTLDPKDKQTIIKWLKE